MGIGETLSGVSLSAEGGAGGGATSYASVAALRAVTPSDGDLAKVAGVTGLVVEGESSVWVPDPMQGGVLVPGVKWGADATNGYTQEVGTSLSVEADGLRLVIDNTSPANDGRFGEWQTFYTNEESVSMPLGTCVLTGGSLQIKVVASVERVVAQNNINFAVGICDPDAKNTGVAVRLYWTGTKYETWTTDYNAGTRSTTKAGDSHNVGTGAAEQEVVATITINDWGRRVTYYFDLDDGNTMEGNERTLTDAHPFVVHLKTASPELLFWFGAGRDNSAGGEFRLKIKSVSLVAS